MVASRQIFNAEVIGSIWGISESDLDNFEPPKMGIPSMDKEEKVSKKGARSKKDWAKREAVPLMQQSLALAICL